MLDISAYSFLETLYCGSNSLNALDVSRNPNLQLLSFADNQITTIDVSENTELKKLYCSRNPLTGLDISKNTMLKELCCTQDSLSSLDVSHNKMLEFFLCYRNHLINLDISDHPSLITLCCDRNQITSLNTAGDTSLIYHVCHDNQLSSLDLSDNKNLEYLYCFNNNLTEIDVTKNNSLKRLWFSNNKIDTLDISDNPDLITLECDNNFLTLSTLPTRQSGWSMYRYAPQRPIYIIKEVSNEDTLDFSREYVVGEDTSVFVWRTNSGTILQQDADYSIYNGKITFLKPQSDSVYCEMSNAMFPDFKGDSILRTTNTYLNIEKEEIPVSGNELIEEEILIYSNNKAIHINTPYNIQVSIFDIQGNLVIEKPLKDGTNVIPMQRSGLYFVHIMGNSDSFTQELYVY